MAHDPRDPVLKTYADKHTLTVGDPRDPILASYEDKAVRIVVSGSITSSTKEADIVSGGRQIIITVFSDTWVSTLGIKELTSVVTVADESGSLSGTNFDIYDADGVYYYVWYNVDEMDSDPTIGGIGIEVEISADDSAELVALATRWWINTQYPSKFVASIDFSPGSDETEVLIRAYGTGNTTDAADGSMMATGFTISTTRQGNAAGPFDDERLTSIRNHMNSDITSGGYASSQWNLVVKGNEVAGNIVRTNDRVVTWTLSAHASYDTDVLETITSTIGHNALTISTSNVVGGTEASFTVGIDSTPGVSVPIRQIQRFNHLLVR